MKWLTSCKQASRSLSESLEHPLPLPRRAALWMHLMMCSACRKYRKQMIGLNRLVRRRVHETSEPVAELDAATRKRLVERLQQSSGTLTKGQPTA